MLHNSYLKTTALDRELSEHSSHRSSVQQFFGKCHTKQSGCQETVVHSMQNPDICNRSSEIIIIKKKQKQMTEYRNKCQTIVDAFDKSASSDISIFFILVRIYFRTTFFKPILREMCEFVFSTFLSLIFMQMFYKY